MADVNLYFYVENLGLAQAQKDTLVAELKTIGKRDSDNNPRYRNHWRVRLDNEAVIFEGVFDDANLSAVGVRNRLAAIFGVANTSITYATTQTAFGPTVVYTYNAIARLRVGVFGGLTATYQESQAQVLAYLAANMAAWDAVEWQTINLS